MKLMTIAVTSSILLTSGYTYISVVSEGAQDTKETTKWNHYMVGGLAPVKVSNSKEIANGEENYTVKTRKTFVNGLISGLLLEYTLLLQLLNNCRI